ncbi:3-methyladenine DNA glycosylase [Loigolactobacillus rennini DSM 20253]|uniref:3-methyladenine DNA glycosylase n=2 Tax=Loigolactobacillus rennini TaxID=238013 RepID=A0A0R2D4Z5_9LACO|nr:3-methyladenine DNA glycosylase [Loigolactobacillus rennini DSM 20253]
MLKGGIYMDAHDQTCWQSNGTKEYHAYFGTPTHNDHILFELLTVGVFQVGLSWQAAASKLPVYRRVFAGMDIAKVAAFDQADIERIAAEPAMIRNPQKIRATVTNARAILAVQHEFGSFAAYLWQFVNQVPLLIKYQAPEDVDHQAPLTTKVAKDMKRRGFKYVGPIVTHMFMRAAGIVQVMD